MSTYRHAAGAVACLAAFALAPQVASAHGVVGKRFFPATMAIDDPLPADELGVTTSSASPDPDTDAVEVSGEYSKKITDRLALSLGKAWRQDRADGEKVSGYDNLGTGLKYRLLANPKHEFALSAGVDVDWGGTGDAAIGAESTTFVSPALFVGKGLGDASAPWLRPLAVTGVVALDIPTRNHVDDEDIPQTLAYGFSVQYSLPYLRQNVHDYGWGEVVGRLTPIVEAQFETPTARADDQKTTGTVRPGVLWTGRNVQLGAEAILPINDASGDGVGFALQLHLYLDDMFPHSLGRPLFQGGAS